LPGGVDSMTCGRDTRGRMKCDMAHLETERLAREERRGVTTGLGRCPECDALVPVRMVDEINHGRIRGVCRCLCGTVWEVELAA